MTILAADVSSSVLNVGIVAGATVHELYEHGVTDHSMRLLPAIESVLSNAALSLDAVSLIAIGAGPGSFTSLRVGFSMLKAMAYAKNIPIVSVPSLAMLAKNISDAGVSSSTRAALIDARKNSVYATVYRGAEAVIENKDIIAESLIELLKADAAITAVGDGALRYRTLFAEKLPQMTIPDDESMHRMRIANMASYARDRIAAGTDENALNILPIYARPSEAEYNRAKGVIL